MNINNNLKDLNDVIERTIQKVLSNNTNTNNYYKNINKHSKSSKWSIRITMENYKKGRTVCKNCYNTNTYKLMKKLFGVLEKTSSKNKKVQSNSQLNKKVQPNEKNNEVRVLRLMYL